MRDGALFAFAPKGPTLRITEVATALAALDVLFLLFVINPDAVIARVNVARMASADSQSDSTSRTPRR